jgi:uncharacterized cupredoxin-like copper-binding protein
MKPDSELAVRLVKTRDAATAILRKMEIKPRDYDFYIEKLSNGKFAVKVEKAELFLKSLKQAKGKLAEIIVGDPVKEHEAVVKAAKTKRVERESCSSVAKSLILAGKTNQEVWDVISKQFKLDASKKHYPTWYRCQLKRLAKKVPHV